MFKCFKCSKSSARQHRVVVERRAHDHLPAGQERGPKGGHGSQIVREISVCEECVSSTPEALKPEVVPVPVGEAA